jgi:hypothetical protein
VWVLETLGKVVPLRVVRFARENTSWGYCRISGGLSRIDPAFSKL